MLMDVEVSMVLLPQSITTESDSILSNIKPSSSCEATQGPLVGAQAVGGKGGVVGDDAVEGGVDGVGRLRLRSPFSKSRDQKLASSLRTFSSI
jgi:hypothetical protein